MGKLSLGEVSDFCKIKQLVEGRAGVAIQVFLTIFFHLLVPFCVAPDIHPSIHPSIHSFIHFISAVSQVLRIHPLHPLGPFTHSDQLYMCSVKNRKTVND